VEEGSGRHDDTATQTFGNQVEEQDMEPGLEELGDSVWTEIDHVEMYDDMPMNY
jgi:hypothetical protein